VAERRRGARSGHWSDTSSITASYAPVPRRFQRRRQQPRRQRRSSKLVARHRLASGDRDPEVPDFPPTLSPVATCRS